MKNKWYIKKNKKNAIYGEMAIILRRFKFFSQWINKGIGKNVIYREIEINLEDLRIEVYFMNK